VRRIAYLMVAFQAFDGITFLWAASIFGLSGEAGPMAAFLGDETWIVLVKTLTILWVLMMVKATLARRAPWMALTVLVFGCIMGLVGTASNLTSIEIGR
jgi:hypothetical protein